MRGRIRAGAGEDGGDVIGSLVMNRFQVDERLGGGGFGAVYRAWDNRLERHVAVKAIEVGGDTGRRILREAHAAARLNHPGIVTLYELGCQDGVWLMVTELVQGGTLRDRCSAGDLGDRDVAEIGADLCDALAHAHAQGIVHRDIKPQNVLISDTAATAKLSDFGIGRLLDHADIPADGPLPPAMAYLSPEQAAGAQGGPQTDVYSLGLTLRECFARGAKTRRSSLAKARPDLPHRLTRAIDASLHPHPDHRPTVENLGAAIEDSLPELEKGARPAPAGSPTDPSLAAAVATAEPPAIAFAAALAGLVAAAAASIGLPGALPLLAVAPVASLLSFIRPERALGLALASVCAWLALPAGLPGSAAVLGAAGLTCAWLLRGAGRRVILPGAAPVLGAAGIALVIPLLAALAETARRRAFFCLAGLVCAALAEAALERNLLPLVQAPAAEPGWQGSLTAAFADILLPLLAQPGMWAVCLLSMAAAMWLGERAAPLFSRQGGPSPATAPRRSRRPALRSLPAAGGRGPLLP